MTAAMQNRVCVGPNVGFGPTSEEVVTKQQAIQLRRPACVVDEPFDGSPPHRQAEYRDVRFQKHLK